MISQSLVLLLSALIASSAAADAQQERALQLPPTVYQEQKDDAQHILLIQTTSNGTATQVLESACGPDTYYDTTSIILGVNRTVNPTATAIGSNNKGEVLSSCEDVAFTTYEKEWTEGCTGAIDPGVKPVGWCGYVYLTENPVPGKPYVLAAGGESFESARGRWRRVVLVVRGCCRRLVTFLSLFFRWLVHGAAFFDF